ncbi:ATP-binding protein [Escherichia coli]
MTVRGIAPENVSTCSSRLSAAHSARTISGTGLGLAIVQRIVDNHNGMLEARHQPAGGLSIRAWLPVPVNAGAGHDKRRNKTEAKVFLFCFL